MRAVPVRSRLSIGILAAGLLVGTAAGAVIGAQQHAVYRATATVFVSSTQVSTIGDPSYVGESAPSPGVFGEQVVSSYRSIATTPFLLNRVITELGLGTGADALARRVHVDNPAGTVLLRVGVDDARPTDAVRIADAIAGAEVDAASHLSPQGPGGVQVTLVERSARTVQQVVPDVPLDLVLGAAIGLVAAAAILLLRHRDAVRRLWRRWTRSSTRNAASMFE